MNSTNERRDIKKIIKKNSILYLNSLKKLVGNRINSSEARKRIFLIRANSLNFDNLKKMHA